MALPPLRHWPVAEGRTLPPGLGPVGGALPPPEPPASWRERLASLLVGACLRVLRLESGEVLVVRGPRPEAARVAALVRALHGGRAGDPVAVWLPAGSRLHVERAALDQEERGYLSPDDRRRDREVFAGVPEEGSCEAG